MSTSTSTIKTTTQATWNQEEEEDSYCLKKRKSIAWIGPNFEQIEEARDSEEAYLH